MKLKFFIALLILLPVLVWASGMMQVGLLFQPMSTDVPPTVSNAITTESGVRLTTESGDVLRTETP